MDDDETPPLEGEPSETRREPAVTMEEFGQVDIERPLKGNDHVDANTLSNIYFKAADVAAEAGNSLEDRVYRTLAHVCGIQLRTEDKAKPWGASVDMGRYRAAIPEDFKGAENDAFADIAERIVHPGLRARLADIAWSNDRKLGKAATLAIQAYGVCADGLISGRYTPHYQPDKRASLEALHMLQRAFQIAHATTKKAAKKKAIFPDILTTSLQALYQQAITEEAYVVFESCAELALHYSVMEPAQIAPDAEALASQAETGSYAMPVKGLWDLAASLYRHLENPEARRRCQLGSFRQLLAMRDSIPSSSAKAFWASQALDALRHIPDTDDLSAELIVELRSLQRASLNEMGSFKLDLKIGDMRDEVEAEFYDLDLPTALLKFARLTGSQPVQQLRDEALQQFGTSPLLSMFGTSIIDGEGKSVSNAPGAGIGGEPNETWFRHTIDTSENIRRTQMIAGAIDPARRVIQSQWNIAERHIEPIVLHSPFVPPHHGGILALGFTRFFQGDFMSAAHLILSQMEPCLRHLLKIAGHDPVKRFDDGTEEDYDLGNMLSRFKSQLTELLGEDLLFELDLLFGDKPGPSLRNELAHGHISSGGCYRPTVLYGCWFMYRLTVIFLMDQWEKAIAPDIAAAV